MPFFQYRAMQPDGAVAEGAIEAGGRQEAFRILDERGLNPLHLEEKADEGDGGSLFSGLKFQMRPKKVKFNQLENFTRQLSNLLSSGVSLSKALRLLSREASTPIAKEKWKGIYDLVIDGASLADAMRQSPETFPKIYIAMVRAGEMGGFLDTVLSEIADFQSREKELRGKVIAAMVYPIILGSLAVAAVSYLMVFFIPRFQQMFSDFGAALPIMTTIVIQASYMARHYGIFVLAALAGLVYMFQTWKNSETGRRKWEHIQLRMPVIGPLKAQFALSRFCRMLGTLLAAGVPLVSALRVAQESLGAQTLIDALSHSIDRVKQGDRLSTSLADCAQLFPGSVLEMVAVAEESGTLDKELMRLAAVTEGDLDRALKMAVALAEPVLLCIMASVIGFIIVSMVLPIFTIGDLIQ